MSGLAILPNLADYDSARASFSWEQVYLQLDGLPEGGGLNIAHEALDRFVNAGKGEVVALRWIRKDMQTQDFSYLELKLLTNRFANLLSRLGILKGETVYSLLGRLPELYISALGSLKAGAVFCPLFSVFGPEPVYQRLLPGKAALLVTTRELFEKKVRDQLGRLPFSALFCW
jgi:acetyl-CoA synthetase